MEEAVNIQTRFKDLNFDTTDKLDPNFNNHAELFWGILEPKFEQTPALLEPKLEQTHGLLESILEQTPRILEPKLEQTPRCMEPKLEQTHGLLTLN